MARSWLINDRGIARKVKNAGLSPALQIKDNGAYRECPNCHYFIDNSDVSHEWPGLPAGVKFDPSDLELLEHLAAKCGVGTSKLHQLIDVFIPTLDGGEGICSTHPKDLPGAKKDGSSVHFFHRTVNAYATGQRKRRKIHSQHSSAVEHVRWHKTGKTKSVIENGTQKGCKKIMVLYKSSKKGSKPDKSNWVMHQYHLGSDENEKDGEYVVSKIFYQQQKQTDKNDDCLNNEDPDTNTLRTSPRTPKILNPPRPGKSGLHDDVAEDRITLAEDSITRSPAQIIPESFYAPPSTGQPEDDVQYPAWLAGESQAAEDPDPYIADDTLLCKEMFNSCAPFNDSGFNLGPNSGYASNTNNVMGDNKATYGIADLENLELDTPPDFQLSDLQFGSQDSVFDWLDRL